MAHRQLFAVTFLASGLWLAACGGGGTLPEPSVDETSDQAPGNADQPPVNPDQPPGNSDQPPGAGQPGGGTPPSAGGNACEQFCDRYGNDCSGMNQANVIVRSLCGRGCDDLLAKQECTSTFTNLLTCVQGLQGLCTEAGPSNSDVQRCTGPYQAWTNCEDQGTDDPPVITPMACTQAGGCDCTDDCATCRCALGEASTTCDAICP